jgi:DNA polymerase elongation subunit (family B)
MEDHVHHKPQVVDRRTQRGVEASLGASLDLLVTSVLVEPRRADVCDDATQRPCEFGVSSSHDETRDRVYAYLFGRTREDVVSEAKTVISAKGDSVCVEVPFSLEFYVRVPASWEAFPQRIRQLLDAMTEAVPGGYKYKNNLTGTYVRRRHACGYRPEPYYLFVHTLCASHALYEAFRRSFSSNTTKRRIAKPNTKFPRAGPYDKLLTTENLLKWGLPLDLHSFVEYNNNLPTPCVASASETLPLRPLKRKSMMLAKPNTEDNQPAKARQQSAEQQVEEQGKQEDTPSMVFARWEDKELFVCHGFEGFATQFLTRVGVTNNGFVRVKFGGFTKHGKLRRGFSNCDAEVVTTFEALACVPLEEISQEETTHLVMLGFDIECCSDNPQTHPQVFRPFDKVTQIGCQAASFDKQVESVFTIFTLGDPSGAIKHVAPTSTTTKHGLPDLSYRSEVGKVGEVEVRAGKRLVNYVPCTSESQLLLRFAEYVRQIDVDFYVTYNGSEFDWRYLYNRACMIDFCQKASSWDDAEFTWKVKRVLKQRYAPHHASYLKLLAKYSEDQDNKVFKQEEQVAFKHMAEALRWDTKFYFKMPELSAYEQAIWNIPNVGMLKQAFDSFRTQPSVSMFFYFHRLRTRKVEADARTIVTAAFGTRTTFVGADARTNFDMLITVREDCKLECNKLDFVAEHLLKVKGKDDLAEHHLANKFVDLVHTKDQDNREAFRPNAYKVMYEYMKTAPSHPHHAECVKTVCDYCVQDVAITVDLCLHLTRHLWVLSMFKLNRVLPRDIVTRGQGVRMEANVAFESLGRMVGNSFDKSHSTPPYEGAIVLEPKPGLHGGPNEWTTCLDFASLYPTIIRELLLCISTYIIPCDVPRMLDLVSKGLHPPIMALAYTEAYQKGKEIIVMVGKGCQTVPARNTAYYAVLDIEDTIMPRFLTRLGLERNRIKKVMAEAEDAASCVTNLLVAVGDSDKYADSCRDLKQGMRKVLEADMPDKKKLEEASLEELKYLKAKFVAKNEVANTNQLSVKVVMNASYGGLGTKKGRFSGFKEIAMTITWRGRWAIQVTRDFVLGYTSQAHVKADSRWADVKLDVIYGDTDSVFVKMTNTKNKVMTIADAWYYAKAVSKEATQKLYRKPHVLEDEYVARRIAFFSEFSNEMGRQVGVRKCYIYEQNMTQDPAKAKLSFKGIDLKRRGNMDVVTEVATQVVHSIFKYDEDLDSTRKRVFEVVKKAVRAVQNNTLPPEKCVKSVAFSKPLYEYANQNLPHVKCAREEQEAYQKGVIDHAPQVGERINMVPIECLNASRYRLKSGKLGDIPTAELVVSKALFDPKLHTLNCDTILKAIGPSLIQKCQPVGIDPRPLFAACKKYREMQATQDVGVDSVKLAQCLIKPASKLAKANCTTLDGSGTKVRLIANSKRKKALSEAELAQPKRVCKDVATATKRTKASSKFVQSSLATMLKLKAESKPGQGSTPPNDSTKKSRNPKTGTKLKASKQRQLAISAYNKTTKE